MRICFGEFLSVTSCYSLPYIHAVFWASGALLWLAMSLIGFWFAVVGAVHQITRRH